MGLKELTEFYLREINALLKSEVSIKKRSVQWGCWVLNGFLC